MAGAISQTADAVFNRTFSDDEHRIRRLAVAGADQLRSPSGHTRPIAEVALARDRPIAATLGEDQQVRFWRIGQAPPLSETFTASVGAKARGVALGREWLAFGDTGGGCHRQPDYGRATRHFPAPA